MRDILEPSDPAIRGALAALERAAAEARRIAIQTGTDLIVMRNGQICRIPPEEIAKRPPVVEPRTGWAEAAVATPAEGLLDGPSATRFDNED
jgi:hypothetical protein